MNSKNKNIVAWVIAGLLAAFFLFMGLAKLTGDPTTAANFEKWGYPSNLMYITGVLEILGAIGILIPRLRFLAALGLIGVMLGATYTHISHGEFGALAMPIVPMILLGVLAFLRKPIKSATSIA